MVAGNAVDLEFFPESIRELQAVHAQIRIILILNGSRKQYLRSQIAEFTDKNVDIIFDDNGFDVQVLISFLKKGKLQAHHRIGLSEERDTVEMMPRREPVRESFYQADGHYTIAVMDATHGAGAEQSTNKREFTYKEVLDKIRHTISKNHSSELIDVLYSKDASEKLKNLIVRYLNQNRLSVAECRNISELADRIMRIWRVLGY